MTLDAAELKEALEIVCCAAPTCRPVLFHTAVREATAEEEALRHPVASVRQNRLEEVIRKRENQEGWKGFYDCALAAGKLGDGRRGVQYLTQALKAGGDRSVRVWLLLELLLRQTRPLVAERVIRLAQRKVKESRFLIVFNFFFSF
jgi:hypothetical protein